MHRQSVEDKHAMKKIDNEIQFDVNRWCNCIMLGQHCDDAYISERVNVTEYKKIGGSEGGKDTVMVGWCS